MARPTTLPVFRCRGRRGRSPVPSYGRSSPSVMPYMFTRTRSAGSPWRASQGRSGLELERLPSEHHETQAQVAGSARIPFLDARTGAGRRAAIWLSYGHALSGEGGRGKACGCCGRPGAEPTTRRGPPCNSAPHNPQTGHVERVVVDEPTRRRGSVGGEHRGGLASKSRVTLPWSSPRRPARTPVEPEGVE
jgi:hypothetical protein